MDALETLGRGEGVRELAPHLGDLPHWYEGGQGQQRQEGHGPRVQRAMPSQSSSRDGDGEAPQARGDLLQSALARKVSKEWHAGLRVGARAHRELALSTCLLLECCHFRKTLNGVDGVGVE